VTGPTDWLVYMELPLPAAVLTDSPSGHADWAARNKARLSTSDAGGLAAELQVDSPDVCTAITQAVATVTDWLRAAGHDVRPDYVEACTGENQRAIPRSIL
jgi:hypothetical protein